MGATLSEAKVNSRDFETVVRHVIGHVIGTFRSNYEYKFFNVYPVRMRDCVRLSLQLVLS